MKRTLSLTLIVVLVLLAACSGRPTQPSGAAETPSGEIFQIALPRLIVDLDRNGVPSVLGISPLMLSALGVDVAGLAVPPDTVDALVKAGIQHIELASVGDRLGILVNGKPMPQLGWTEASMKQALNLAEAFGLQGADTIGKLLPWVTRLGLDVVIRFPRDGAAEIPVGAAGAIKSLTLSPLSDLPSWVSKLEVKFDPAGTPAILGVSARDLAAFGLKDVNIALAPEFLTKLQGGNIQHLELRSKADGLRLYANGEPLPTLFWDSQLLANLVEVYGLLQPQDTFKPLVDVLGPTLDRADIGILLHFPLASGEQPIPAKMHD